MGAWLFHWESNFALRVSKFDDDKEYVCHIHPPLLDKVDAQHLREAAIIEGYWPSKGLQPLAPLHIFSDHIVFLSPQQMRLQ